LQKIRKQKRQKIKKLTIISGDWTKQKDAKRSPCFKRENTLASLRYQSFH
jgi:hypothetical protein